ncbi:fatty acid-binding protein, muscle-like [Daphnia pulicaria]|nr:fatty acid-binding protein, muscle-like [Daphnia pulicaria]
MVYESTGKFQLVEGDVDNFDKMMEAVGVSAEKRQKGRTLKPIIEFSHDGDKYKVTGSAEGIPERTKEFVLDVEQEETTIDGRKVKSTYKREAKGLMIQHEVQENGMVVVYHREIKGDQMHVKVTCGDLVANRLYKKM